MNKIGVLLILVGVITSACQDKEYSFISPANDGKIKLYYKSISSHEELRNANAFLFSGNILSNKQQSQTSDPNHLFEIDIKTSSSDKLLFLAGDNQLNLSSDVSLSQLKTTTTPIADFISSFPQVYYTAEKELSANTGSSLDLFLSRSTAVIDLKITSNIQIQFDSCVISNIADRAFVFQNDRIPSETKFIAARFNAKAFNNFAENLLPNFAYLYESNGQAPTATFYTHVNGDNKSISVQLPENIERNKRYEIRFEYDGAKLYTNLQVVPWEDGGSVNARPESSFIPTFNVHNSELPAFASFNSDKNKLIVASCDTSFILAIDAPVELDAKIENPNIRIIPLTDASAEYPLGNRFRLEFKQSAINAETEEIRLYVKSKLLSQYNGQYLTIEKKANRLQFKEYTGQLDKTNIQYADYIDGVLSKVHILEAPIAIHTKSIDNQYNWIRILKKSANNFELQGGFYPNDTEAVGQTQTSTLYVQFKDGAIEKYAIKRQRHAIPVVHIGNRYWSKYNMRGNSKSYADQIKFDQNSDFWEFLKTCSSDEYIYYAGAQYKGLNRTGLYLQNNNNRLMYPEYHSIPDAPIFNASPNLHCPPGYQLPSQWDFNELLNDTQQLTLNPNGQHTDYISINNREFRIERYQRRGVQISGVTLEEAHHIKLTDKKTNQSIVLNGLPHQYSGNNGVAFGHLIFATINTRPDYIDLNFTTNRFRYQYHNNSKTKIVRCVKSPTPYIINE